MEPADCNGNNKNEITELIMDVNRRIPELLLVSYGLRQVSRQMSQGSVVALGSPVVVLTDTEDLIPITPTHVVVAKEDSMGYRGIRR